MDDARFKMIMKFIEWGDLNDWEHKFLESMEHKLLMNFILTDKEEVKLEEIYAKQ